MNKHEVRILSLKANKKSCSLELTSSNEKGKYIFFTKAFLDPELYRQKNGFAETERLFLEISAALFQVLWEEGQDRFFEEIDKLMETETWEDPRIDFSSKATFEELLNLLNTLGTTISPGNVERIRAFLVNGLNNAH